MIQFTAPDGSTHNIALTPGEVYRVTVNDATYDVVLHNQTDTLVHFSVNGQPWRVHVAQAGNRFAIAAQGRHTILQKTTAATRRSAGHSDHDLSAQMPGQIIEVAVAVGEHVTQGQTLIVMEAMKMEMRIKAPHDGTVTALQCAVGDTVQRGQTLVEVSE